MASPFSLRGSGPPVYERTRRLPGAGITPGLAVSAAAGGASPLAVLLDRVATGLIDDAAEARAEIVTREAAVKGQQAGDAAAQGGAAPEPRDDGTLAGRAFDRAQLAAWAARTDLRLTGESNRIAMAHRDRPDADAAGAQWDAMGAGLLAQLPPDLRTTVGQDLAGRRQRLVQGLAERQHDQEKEAVNADILAGQTAAMQDAANAWRKGDAATGAGHDARFHDYLLSRTDLDERAKVRERDAYFTAMRRHDALGKFDRAKARGLDAGESFIRDFRLPDRYPEFDPDTRESIAGEMTRHLHELKAERQVAVTALHGDARTALDLADRGYPVPQLDGLAARARGLDPDLAATIEGTAADIRWRHDLATQPPAEIARAVAEEKARADAAPELAAKARHAGRHQAALRVWQATGQELDADPLGHAMRQGRVPAVPLDPANPAAEALSARALARDKAAAFYGRPVPLLTVPEAKGLVAGIGTAPAEAMADTVGNLERRYGDRWPEVYGQLVRHDLAPEYRVLATVADPVARVKLAEGFRLGKDMAKKAIDKDAVKTVDAAVDDHLEDFRATFAYAPDGPRVVDQYGEAAKLLAYRYAGTMAPGDAAANAVRAVATGRYDFHVDARHAARAPKGQGAAAEHRAAVLLAKLKAADLPDPGGAPGTTADYRRDQALSAARRGRWVTTPGDDGWLLLDVTGQPVMKKDGAPLRFSFADVKRRQVGVE